MRFKALGIALLAAAVLVGLQIPRSLNNPGPAPSVQTAFTMQPGPTSDTPSVVPEPQSYFRFMFTNPATLPLFLFTESVLLASLGSRLLFARP